MVAELIAQGFTGDALVEKVMALTGLDDDDARDLIATETTSPDGDLVEEDE